mmetsp:Transcript_24556/g.61834  ORF Transcript_24556/g.61834 Transcript_24556/m.61834 type:complete len:283 (+) Transcript_24556:238-1086(+)
MAQQGRCALCWPLPTAPPSRRLTSPSSAPWWQPTSCCCRASRSWARRKTTPRALRGVPRRPRMPRPASPLWWGPAGCSRGGPAGAGCRRAACWTPAGRSSPCCTSRTKWALTPPGCSATEGAPSPPRAALPVSRRTTRPRWCRCSQRSSLPVLWALQACASWRSRGFCRCASAASRRCSPACGPPASRCCASCRCGPPPCLQKLPYSAPYPLRSTKCRWALQVGLWESRLQLCPADCVDIAGATPGLESVCRSLPRSASCLFDSLEAAPNHITKAALSCGYA